MTKPSTLVTIAALLLGSMAATPAAGADAKAGKAKAAICAGCHGVAGQSAQPMWPNLAGQSAAYLADQLRRFKAGERNNAQMAPMVAALTDADMDDLAAFYAGLAPATNVARGDIEPGERLYRGGDPERSIPACMSCHGPAGQGMPAAAYPAVSGQHAAYSLAQLQAFRSGVRGNDMMVAIAARLTDAELSSLAEYMAGLR